MMEIVQQGRRLFGGLEAEVRVGGVWRGAGDGFRLEVRRGEGFGGETLRLAFTNATGATVRLEGLRLVQRGSHDDALQVPGERLRVFRQGWTMASASGSMRHGDHDFEVGPWYRPFALSQPSDYDSETPNRFHGEYVAILNDRETDFCVLAGFITSAHMGTRVTFVLDDGGVAECAMTSDADGREVDDGETVLSETLLILSGTDGYGLLQRFAQAWGESMGARLGSHLPNGWCSWYYYFDKVTESDIIENADYLERHRDEYPLEYLQLDDGYQSALGDWLVCNEKFPHGLESLAGEIRRRGLKPGIWLAPFLVERRSRLFAEHPDWMVRGADGEIAFPMKWRSGEAAILDGTHPDAQRHLTDLFRRLRQMGWVYTKLDFLVYECGVPGARFHDRKATRVEALRRGLEAIRRGFGDDQFILGCTTPFGCVVGLVDAERVGTDITPYWAPDGRCYSEAPTVPNVCRNLINHSYMNHRLFFSDPDTHIARTDNNRLTESEVILWTYAIWFTGGMLLLSDRFETLVPERAAYAKLLIRDQDRLQARPLDFFERSYPAVWLGVDKATGQRFVGLFNFDDGEQTLTIPLDRIDRDAAFRVRDRLADADLGLHRHELSLAVPPHACRVLELRPDA